MAYIRTIDELGGMVRAIDRGYPQKEIADAAYRYQLLDDRGDKVVVGVNKYVMDDRPMAYHKIDDAIEHEQVARVVAVKAGRDAARVEKRLKQARGGLSERRERDARARGCGEGLRLARGDLRRVPPGLRPVQGADYF